MAGRSFHLTAKELKAVIDSCGEWVDMMSEGDSTIDLAEKRLNNGLGSALRKLSVGTNGENIYRNYKTVR